MTELSLERGLDTLDGRAAIARVTIWAYIVLTAVAMLAHVGELSGNLDIEAPGLLPSLAAMAYLGYALCFFGAVVAVSMWIHRAHANLFSAGFEGLEFTPGWSVGWFFVPVANLFKPFQAMRELWNASHQQEDAFASEPDRRLKLWWGMWIAGNALGNLSGKSFLQSGETGLSAGLVVDLAAFAIMIVAAWLLLQIIEAITRAQRSMMGLAQTFA